MRTQMLFLLQSTMGSIYRRDLLRLQAAASNEAPSREMITGRQQVGSKNTLKFCFLIAGFGKAGNISGVLGCWDLLSTP